jgi:hypothetical protein
MKANRNKRCIPSAAHEAAATGNLLILQWLHKYYSAQFDSGVMDSAASEGQLETVEWLHNNRCEGCTAKAMNGAARNGHLDVVRWLHVHRTEVACLDRRLLFELSTPHEFMLRNLTF